MMNLVIDGILNRHHAWHFPLPERFVNLAESFGGNLPELFVQLSSLLVPNLQKLALGRWLGPLKLLPFACGHAFCNRHSHSNKLPGHLGEWPHAADRKLKQLLLRERLNRLPSEIPVSMPVLQ